MRKLFLTLNSLFLASGFFSQAPVGPGGVGTSSELSVWLDASKITASDGDFLSSWSDQSGNGNNFSQSSAPLQPFLSANSSINGLPAVSFNSDFMQSGTIPSIESNQLSWIIVSNTSNTNTQVLLRSDYSSGTTFNASRMWGNFSTSTEFISHAREVNGTIVKLIDSYNLGSHIWSSRWNGTSLFESYIDQSLIASSNLAAANPSSHNTIFLGAANATNQYPFSGDVAEVIVFNATLNNAQRIIVDNYLSTKYSIPLSSNDYFSFDATFGNDLAGIGREDASNEHLDAQGEGILRVTSSGLDDGEYLIWGHNNGPLSSTATGIPASLGGSGAMLERIWRFSETGSGFGSITISFDLSSGIAFGDPNSYYLYTDSDGDFTSGAVGPIGPSTISSGSVSFTLTDLQLNDGDHLILANGDADIISIVDGQTWNDPTTWNCNCVPNSGNNVTIDANHTVRVQAPSSSLDLTVSGSGSLSLQGTTLNIEGNLDMQSGSNNFLSGVLDVEGNFSNSGTSISSGLYSFIGGNWDNSLGTFNYSSDDSTTFDGNSPSSISGSTDWYILTIDNTAGVSISSGTHNIFGILNLVSGSFNTSNSVTLKSDATGTAQMDNIESGSIIGNITVERLLSMGTQGWREITSPVQGTNLIDWQNNGIIFSGFSNSTFPNFAWVNALSYSEPNALGNKNNGWVDATDAFSNATGPSNGYRIYMDATDYTLSVSGTPYSGSQTINVTQTGGAGSGDDQNGWNLIGNPYPCTIDWNLVSKTGIEDAIWTWNATAGNYGLYWSAGGTATNNVTKEIAHSQAFWVKAIQASGNVTIDENDKIRVDKAFVKSSSTSNDMHIHLNGNQNTYSDEIIVRRVSNASDSYDLGLEFPKLFTELPDLAPSLSVLCEDSIDLSVAAVDKDSNSEIKLKANSGLNAQGTYTLNFTIPEGFMDYGCIHLEDLHNGIITDLRVDSSYTFQSSDTTTVPRFLLKMFRDYNVSSIDASCFNYDDASITIEGDFLNANTYDIFSSGTLVSSTTANGNTVVFDDLYSGNYQIYTNQILSCDNNISEIVITEPDEVLAEFSYNSDTLILGSQPVQLQLTNQSLGADIYAWDFDDGNFSYEIHPINFYTFSGDFTVRLVAENSLLPSCYDDVFHTITVLDSLSTGLNNPTTEIVEIEAYKFGNEIIIQSSANLKDAKIEVYNSIGQLLKCKNIDLASFEVIRIPLDGKNQIYFLVVSNSEQVKTFKLF